MSNAPYYIRAINLDNLPPGWSKTTAESYYEYRYCGPNPDDLMGDRYTIDVSKEIILYHGSFNSALRAIFNGRKNNGL